MSVFVNNWKAALAVESDDRAATLSVCTYALTFYEWHSTVRLTASATDVQAMFFPAVSP